ncbi:hypothetical protein ACSQ67_026117 [Phaseolus vulgaris]
MIWLKQKQPCNKVILWYILTLPFHKNNACMESNGSSDYLLSHSKTKESPSTSSPDLNLESLKHTYESKNFDVLDSVKHSDAMYGSFTTIFMGLYVVVHIWLAAPNTIKGLEFGGLDFPDSIGEFLLCVIFVLQGEHMFGKILNLLSSDDLLSHSKTKESPSTSSLGMIETGRQGVITCSRILNRLEACEQILLISQYSPRFSWGYMFLFGFGWLHSSTIQGLEFGGLNLPNSIGEFVFFVVFVLQEIFEFDAMDDPPSVMDVVVCKFDGPFIDFKSMNSIENTDLRLNQPRYATLPNIMKAKSKPIQKFTPEELNVEIISDLEIVEVTEPPKRKAGVIVSSVDELIHKLKNEANVI